LTETATVGRVIPRQLSEHLTEAALIDVVGLAWKRLLGASLRPKRSLGPGRFAVSAQVQLSGMESTVVVVRATQEAASAATVALLGLHEDEVASGDIADAFAEIVVAVGGGVRSLLAGLTKLDAPVVVQGDGLDTAIPGARTICDATLQSAGGAVHVSLWRPRAARRLLGHRG
jgi:hypothetical protein